ncbi:hypothetical protein BDE02_13G138100 [Populus trichocarpa]|nr:hypothetical protein BDE02_13G138100 [Populus trichocarpa]
MVLFLYPILEFEYHFLQKSKIIISVDTENSGNLSINPLDSNLIKSRKRKHLQFHSQVCLHELVDLGVPSPAQN